MGSLKPLHLRCAATLLLWFSLSAVEAAAREEQEGGLDTYASESDDALSWDEWAEEGSMDDADWFSHVKGFFSGGHKKKKPTCEEACKQRFEKCNFSEIKDNLRLGCSDRQQNCLEECKPSGKGEAAEDLAYDNSEVGDGSTDFDAQIGWT